MTKSFVAAGAIWACLSGAPTRILAQNQSVEAGKPLRLTTQAADFTLQFDWQANNGAAPVLTLPNGQTLALQQSRVGKAPGLWQSTAINYQAGQTGRLPLLVKLATNGITLQEGQNLTATSMSGQAAGQPVQLTTPTGSVLVRNVVVRPLANRNVASWVGPVSYKLYKSNLERREDLAGKTPLKTGTTDRISYDVAYGQAGWFTLVFDGKLNVPAAGDYVFDLNQGGVGGLWIDDKPIVPMIYHDLVDPESRTVALSAGPHDVQVQYARTWARPGLGLFVSQPDTRPQPLHADGSLPEVTPISTILVQPEARPTLIRSFVQLPGETHKRTHALSVGNQTGMHYSLDLNQMALLMVWKGDFADVTQMWYERGEPQLLSPAGVVVRPAPSPALALLTSNNAAWPDSLDDKTLVYKGLILDKEGNPAAEYTLAGATVRDQIRPAANALTRTLTVSGNASNLYCRLAASKAVEEVAKGLYAIDDRSYYVRVDPKAPVSVRSSGGRQELIMPVALKGGSATLTYSIEF